MKRPPIAPRLAAVAMFPRDGGEVLVRGRLERALEGTLVLIAGKAEKPCQVGKGGVFVTRLATKGAAIRCHTLRGDQRSGAVELGAVPQLLQLTATHAVVRALPSERVVLIVSVADEELRRYRGTADSGGTCRIPLSILGPKSDGPALDLQVEIENAGRPFRSKRVSAGS